MKRLCNLICIVWVACWSSVHAAIPDCASVARRLNPSLRPATDVEQLAAVLTTLAATGALPDVFVTKRSATAAGWRPGRDLWQVSELKGKSIGGDRFGNFERRLPRGEWREADLDYRGGKRGAKRLVFEPERHGRRFITVDHYASFQEIPACR